jgi:hypothetical protein
VLDRLQEAVKPYLTQVGTDGLSSADVERHTHVLDFAVNLGHAGDIIGRRLADAAARKAKRSLVMSVDDADDLTTFITRVRGDRASPSWRCPLTPSGIGAPSVRRARCGMFRAAFQSAAPIFVTPPGFSPAPVR